jgi:hypothetical protein
LVFLPKSSLAKSAVKKSSLPNSCQQAQTELCSSPDKPIVFPAL